MFIRKAEFLPTVSAVFRVALGAVFLLSSIGKLLEPREEFLGAVRAFALLPQPLDVWYATLLPWVELLVGVLILIGFYWRIAAGTILLMLLSFLIAIEHARGSDEILAACGCFGVFSGTETLAEILMRDALFFLAAAFVFVFPRTKFALENRFTISRDAAGQ